MGATASLDERLKPEIIARQISSDGSRKYVLRYDDGALAEAVAMTHGDPDAPSRFTVCFSTQSGCAMGCAFCATGRLGFTRSLEAAEMAWEDVLVGEDIGQRAEAAIAMGQGEPLANYDALVSAVGYLGSPEGLGIAPERLSISTCGIVPGIHALASDNVPVGLYVSLHAARQELRDELMPGVRAYPLERLHEELARYTEMTGRSVVIEYLMLDGINDGDDDLEALAAFCSGLNARVLLLRYNRSEGIPYAPSAFGKLALWCLELSRRGIPATINAPRGADIDAACGQLAARSS